MNKDTCDKKICWACLVANEDEKCDLKPSVLNDFINFTKYNVDHHRNDFWLCKQCYFLFSKCRVFLEQCQRSLGILQNAGSKINNANEFEDFLAEEKKFIQRPFNLSICHAFNVDLENDITYTNVDKSKNAIYYLNDENRVLINTDSEKVKLEVPIEFCSVRTEFNSKTPFINEDDSYSEDEEYRPKSKRITIKKSVVLNQNTKGKTREKNVKKKDIPGDIAIKELDVTLTDFMRNAPDQKKLTLAVDDDFNDGNDDGGDGDDYDDDDDDDDSITNSDLERITKNAEEKIKKRKRVRTRDMPKAFRENQGFDPALVSVKKLTLEEQIEELEAIKNSEKYLKAAFKCELCGKIFLYENVMIEHQVKHAAEAGEYCCSLCKLRFYQEITYSRHMMAHSMQFKCLQCGKIHTCRSNMVIHLYMKHDPSDKSVKCEFCNKTYKHQKSLANHVKLHTREKEFKCEMCPKVFIRKGELHQHLLIHTGEKLHKCEQCDKKFYTIWQMKTHLVTHNNINKKTGRRKYEKHSADDSSSKDFYCVECNLYYKTQLLLDRHLKYGLKHKTPDMLRFPCRICDMKFDANVKLTVHMDRVHLKRRPYVCEMCSATFTAKTGLSSHIKCVHEGFRHPRVHMCAICGKKFGTKVVLSDHMRIHTGETPFECQICKKKFKQHGTLYTHVKTVHSKVMSSKKRENSGSGRDFSVVVVE